MKYNVVSLRRADDDVRHITHWLAERSLQGAKSWLEAYEQMIMRLTEEAPSFSASIEDSECDVELKQGLFRTRRGQMYRVVFTIVGNEVRILRIRGPGQPTLQQDELW
jgi:plasmid stabilization system protein ParE